MQLATGVLGSLAATQLTCRNGAAVPALFAHVATLVGPVYAVLQATWIQPLAASGACPTQDPSATAPLAGTGLFSVPAAGVQVPWLASAHSVPTHPVSAVGALGTQAQVGEITPANVLELDDGTMRAVGFSRQKSGYARHLSQAILERRFDPDELPGLPDDEVKQRLTALKGIGVWTAEVYLLMVLCRADAWPVGDVALAQAIMEVKNLPARPGHDEVARIGEQWRPWRAAAARILWHHYLSVRKK